MTTLPLTPDKAPPQPVCCPNFPFCNCPDNDAQRVTTDLIIEKLNPSDFDVAGIVTHMRALAGDRPLDSVSDEDWTDALAWYERAPWPTPATTKTVLAR